MNFLKSVYSSIGNFMTKKISIRYLHCFVIFNLAVLIGFIAHLSLYCGLFIDGYFFDDVPFPLEADLPLSKQYTMRYQICQPNEFACQNNMNSFIMCAFSQQNCPDAIPPPLFSNNIALQKTKPQNVPIFQVYYVGNFTKDHLYLKDEFEDYLVRINYQVIESFQNSSIIQFDYYYNQTTIDLKRQFNDELKIPRYLKYLSAIIIIASCILWGFIFLIFFGIVCNAEPLFYEINMINNLEKLYLQFLIRSKYFCLMIWYVPFFLIATLLPFAQLGSLLSNTYSNIFQYIGLVEVADNLTDQYLYDLNHIIYHKSKEDSMNVIKYSNMSLHRLFYKDWVGIIVFTVTFIYSFIMNILAILNVLKLFYQVYLGRYIVCFRQQQGVYIPVYLNRNLQKVISQLPPYSLG
ncbi:hypothetical protein ABPG74_021204 [Tetrahymena malaccensis]